MRKIIDFVFILLRQATCILYRKEKDNQILSYLETYFCGLQVGLLLCSFI